MRWAKRAEERKNDAPEVQAASAAAEPAEPSAFEKLDQPYRDQWELMQDAFALIDYRLYLYYKNHQWLGPKSEMRSMLGLVVSREEFEHNLVKAAQTGLRSKLAPEEDEQIRLGEAAVRRRIGEKGREFPLLQLFERFELDEFGCAAVTLAYAAVLDAKYERLFAYLQDDITKKSPGIALTVQLYLPAGKTVEEYAARFSRETAFTSLFDGGALAEGTLRLEETVLEFLGGGTIPDGTGMEFFDGRTMQPEAPLVTGQALCRELSSMVSAGPQAISLVGPEGVGKRFLLRHAMTNLGQKCLFADLSAMGQSEASVEKALLASRLLDAFLCFCALDSVTAEGETQQAPPEVLRAISRSRPAREPVFFLSGSRLPQSLRPAVMEYELPVPAEQERLALFQHYFQTIPLEESVSLEELSAKFRFVPRQISGAAAQATGLFRLKNLPLSNTEIHRCCYRQVVHRLDRLARRVEPCYSWEDVVLPPAQKALMQQACRHIRYQHRVYQQWGFAEKFGYGKGLSVLFAGPPGTGKTMCAQVMARQLNMELYKINISQIVSKYIGETEKNLQAVFQEARRSNCILFFDECDAIFGKRGDVKDANDRSANMEVAYLLQQIEDHDGVSIMATNLLQNIDAAFMRRITYVVHFPFPEAPQRKEIYLRMLPETAPVSPDVDWDFIAEKFQLSGGHIKNIVLGAAFMAAGENAPIGMKHLLRAAVNEMHKNEIVVVREELREYADLLEEE